MKKLMMAMLLTFVSSYSHSQQSLGATVSEIFMEGSIDGDNLRLVYGFKDMSKDVKEHIKKSVQVKDIKELGQLFYDKEGGHGRKDFVGAFRRGIKDTVHLAEEVPQTAKTIYQGPLKSLKQVPESYRINFENASEAFYESNNQLSGAVRYAGWALWAQVEGAYYLVIEAPVRLAFNAALTGLDITSMASALPVHLAIQTLRIPIHITVMGAKFIGQTAAAVGKAVYSAASTSTAVAITTAVSGGIAIYRGGRWVVSQPRKIFRPFRVTVETEEDFNSQMSFAEKLKNNLENLGDQFELINERVNRFRSRFILSVDGQRSVVIRTKVNSERLVEVSAEGTANLRSFLREQYPEATREEISTKAKMMLYKVITL